MRKQRAFGKASSGSGRQAGLVGKSNGKGAAKGIFFPYTSLASWTEWLSLSAVDHNCQHDGSGRLTKRTKHNFTAVATDGSMEESKQITSWPML
jgi:hypothetical protein